MDNTLVQILQALYEVTKENAALRSENTMLKQGLEEVRAELERLKLAVGGKPSFPQQEGANEMKPEVT